MADNLLLEALSLIEDEEYNERLDKITTGTSGSFITDFAGRFLWGMADEATMSSLSAYDMYRTETKGDAYKSWQDTLVWDDNLKNVEWHELSGAARAGEAIGRTIGMLPSFGVAAKVGKGGIKTAFKIGGVGQKIATRQSKKELIDKAKDITLKKGKDVVAGTGISLSDDAAEKMITRGYEFFKDASDLKKLEEGFKGEIFEKVIANNIKDDIAKIAKVSGEEVDLLSKEVVNIVLKNDPNDAMAALSMLFRQVPGSYGPGGVVGSQVAAAMTVDAAIGFALGSMHAGMDQVKKTQWGVEKNHHTYQYEYTGNKEFDWDEAAGAWWKDATTTGLHFSVIGPVKFGRGGTSVNPIRRGTQIVRHIMKGKKPLKNMTNEQMRAQITAINELSGGLLHRGVNKFNKTIGRSKYPAHDKWWLTRTADSDNALLRNYLNDLRKDFLKGAPYHWAKESIFDVAQSLPRMLTGVAAMNGFHIFDTMKREGFSLDVAWNALGPTPEEKVATIATAMWFTRKPHRLHYDTKNPIAQKIFQTDAVPQYMAFKQQKLRNIMAGMQTYGVKDNAILNDIIYAYGDRSKYSSNNKYNSESRSAIRGHMYQTVEFNALREIFKPYKTIKNDFGGVDLRTAYNKWIADALKDKRISREEAHQLNENLYVAERVLNTYHKNSGEELAIDKYTPEQAYDIVNKVASMKFRDKAINVANVEVELQNFIEHSILGASVPHTRIIKNYLLETLEALGIDYTDRTSTEGRIILPDVADLLGGLRPSTQQTLATVIKRGEQNGWIKVGEVLPMDQVKSITRERYQRAEEILQQSVDAMHLSVWGDGWKGNRHRDDMILENDAWHFAQNDVIKFQRHVNAYEVLKNGSEHKLDVNQVSPLQDKVNAFLRHKRMPEIQNLEGGKEVAPENYGQVKQFIETLHKIVRAINPEINSSRQPTMTFKQAKGLMEAFVGVKGESRGLFGDLFTNRQSLREFENYVQLKALDKLGMRDFQAGLDTKASLATLIRDLKFNNAEGEGSFAKLPSLRRIRETLDVELSAKKISEKTYEDLMEFYEHLHGQIKNSSFHVEWTDIAEPSEGSYRKSLFTSMAVGKDALSMVARDKSRIMEAGLVNEINRLDQIIKTYEEGGFSLDTPVNKKTGKTWNEELTEFISAKESTKRLKDIIKNGLDSKDPYVLDAVAREIGSIDNVLSNLRSQDQSNHRIIYATKMMEIADKIRANVQRRAINESQVMDKIREEFVSFDRSIPGKDVQDKVLRITVSQFAQKYDVNSNHIENIFSIDKTQKQSKQEIELFVQGLLRDYMRDPSKLDASTKASLEDIINSLSKAANEITFDPKTPEGIENFRIHVSEPLKLAMKQGLEKVPLADRPSEADFATDHYTITSNYFSKRVVKTLRLDARDGMESLLQGTKYMGDTKDRGLGAILEALDPDQSFIYLAENSGMNSKGTVIRNIAADREIDGLNALLSSGKFSIRNNKIVEETLRLGESDHWSNTNLENPSVAGERYRIVPMNESTTLIVRVDKTLDNSIHNQIQAQFRPAKGNDTGGDLFKILEAIYDGDLNLNTPQHRAMKRLLSNLNKAQGDVDVVEAIKLTRMIFNMPAYIPDVLENGIINLNHAKIKDLNKRDKLAETKNGYIPTADNRSRSAEIYKNSDSSFHQKAYNLKVYDATGAEISSVRDWFEPSKTHSASGNKKEFRKLKVLSINDEGKIVDRNGNIMTDNSGNEMANVFDALHRHRAKLEQQRRDGDITSPEYDANIKMFKDAYKSVVDGEFFLTFDAYLAKLMMVGLHTDMVRMDSAGNIIGFKSGGLKPTVAQGDVNINKNSPAYGRIEQFFAKTAFKYNPVVEKIMRDLNIDGLTFASANKINSYKSQANSDVIERYSDMRGIQRDQFDQLNKPWTDFIKNNNIVNKHIIEVPLESMSLRTISKEHDPLVGQNAGVHMNHNNGIAEWIGLDAKLKEYNNAMEMQYNNITYRSMLAKKVLSSKAAEGDPSVVNSSIEAILSREGLILEPWAQKKLEDNMIGYFLNNGSLGGGVVKEGSLDIMGADMGNLKPSVHANINGRKTVRYYGEFLPSYYAANKPFIQRGVDPREVHSVIIQKIEYIGETGKRKADAFLTDVNKETFVVVEGRMIDKTGKLFDIDSREPIKIDLKDVKVNKNLYETMTFAEKQVYDAMNNLSQNNLNLQGRIPTIIDYANLLKSMNNNMSVGSINSRQPRNMMGDLVISRIGFNADGNPYNNRKSGNVSLMNFMDAIKPQDADFDFDKSFHYNGAPGKFWRESGKLAGEIVTQSFDATIMKYFGEYGSYSKIVAEQIKGDTSGDAYGALQREISMARGRFIKMHQTLTYMSNIFREFPEIAQFKMKTGDKGEQWFSIKLADNGRYIATVKNVATLAEKFIDMYKSMPSKDTKEAIEKLQNQALFGRDGIFEIGVVTGGRGKEGELLPGTFTADKGADLNAPKYRDLRDAINKRMILPLNAYLGLNRGYGVDASGQDVSARLADYHAAFDILTRNITDPATGKYSKVAESVDINVGLKAFADYFDPRTGSKNPYDVAMKKMHEIYLKTVNIKQHNNVSNTSKHTQEILDYIEGGYNNVPGLQNLDAAQRHNRIFNDALGEYVKDGWRMLRLQDLAKQEKSIAMEIQKLESFQKKSAEETIQIRDLREKLSRVQELKVGMEEALSYMFSGNMDYPPITIQKGKYFSSGKYYHDANKYKQPVVVVDQKGNIKEVIQPGNRNFQQIGNKDKMILNGRRFEVTDGQQQQSLAILFKAFAGMPHVEINGELKSLSTYAIKEYVQRDYRTMVKEIVNLKKNMETVTGSDRALASVKKENLLYEHLFGTEFMPVKEIHTRALILRALTPSISNEKVSIRSNNQMAGKEAVFDYIYRENFLSQDVFSLLAKIASGERVGDKQLAMDILTDINTMKNVSWMAEVNPDMNFKLIQSRMLTEPMSLDGPYTKTKHLNKDIYDLRNSKNEIERDAAKIMIDYAQGKGLVDPVSLYKASRVMTEKNIPVGDQWGRIEYLSNGDGTLRKWGADQIFIRDIDKLNSKNMGERGGVQESVKERIKNDYDCNNLK